MLETVLILLITTMGNITLELDPQKAPATVDNFVKYVEAGHYDGTQFHRVIDNFMVQGGGFDANFRQKATRAPINNEADNGLKNRRGTVAMARTGDPHSATAQFFINTVDNGFLDHKGRTQQGWGYAVFGKVVAGMDVVDRIGKTRTNAQDAPLQAILIKEAHVLKKLQAEDQPAAAEKPAAAPAKTAR
ncbi:MAG: peptidylprolyl isomerase [Gammaproteobacteria bacterium]